MTSPSPTRRHVLAGGTAAAGLSAIGFRVEPAVSAEMAVTCLYDGDLPPANTFAAASRTRGAHCVRLSGDVISTLRKELTRKTHRRLIGMAGYAKFLLLREAMAEMGFHLQSVVMHTAASGGDIQHFTPGSPAASVTLPAGSWPSVAVDALLSGSVKFCADGSVRPALQGRRLYSWLAVPMRDKRRSLSTL